MLKIVCDMLKIVCDMLMRVCETLNFSTGQSLYLNLCVKCGYC